MLSYDVKKQYQFNRSYNQNKKDSSILVKMYNSSQLSVGSSSSSTVSQNNFKCKTQQNLRFSSSILEKQKQKAEIFKEYNQFFYPFCSGAKKQELLQIPEHVLQKHKIKILENCNDRPWSKLINHSHSYVQIVSSNNGGMECEFEVVIGAFFLVVKVLNLHRGSQEMNTEYVGEGAFGQVKKVKIQQKEIAIKKINFASKQHSQLILSNILNAEDFADSFQIKKAINEYCIYKICSMLKIGPQIIYEQNYDLVCYNDCIEFQMELCDPIHNNIDSKKYQNDIKKCLKILHSLKMIHKDIKKQNTLYSPSFKSYILTDFGLTHSVKQQINQKTETYFSGSPTHASPQMKKLLYSGQCGPVNLYLNDIHCLKVTLSMMAMQSPEGSVDFSQNSMSIGGDWSDSIENSSSIQQFQNNSEGGSSMRTPLSSSGSNFTQSTCNTESLFSGDTINYYLIKILNRYLNCKSTKKQNSKKQLIEQILNDTIAKQSDFQILKIQIVRSLYPIINSIEQQLLKLTQIRNLARVFGVNSEQFHSFLDKILKSRDVANIDYDQLGNYSSIFSQFHYNKLVIRKFKNHFLNMDRHICLRNKRALFSSLRTLLKTYLQKQTNPLLQKKDEKQDIIVMGLEVLSFQGLVESEYMQIVLMLSMMLSQKQIKPSDIDAAYCLKLCDDMFLFLESSGKSSLMTIQSLIKIHIQYNDIEGAHKYCQKVDEGTKRLEQKIQGKMVCVSNEESKTIKTDIFRHFLCKIFYYCLIGEYQKAFELSKNTLQKYNKLQFTENHIKIKIYDNLVSILIKLKNFDEASIYNNLLLSQIKVSCFPKRLCAEYAYYHSYEGMILVAKNCFQKALEQFQSVIECTNDELRGSNFVKLIKQTFINMSVCYQKMQDISTSIYYLQKALQFSTTYQYSQPEESIQIIHHIVVRLLKTGKCGPEMSAYADQLAILKIQLIESKRINLSVAKQKQVPFFPFQMIKKERINKENIIQAQKTMLSSVEPYLPRFSSWYVETCEELGNYYLNQEKSIKKALTYFWKVFCSIPKVERTEQIYKKMNSYVDLLIETNASKKALKLLKQYTFYIPEELDSVKNEAQKKLSKLSQDLNTKDKQFYSYICRTNREQTIDEIENDEFKRKIWKKKMNSINLQYHFESGHSSEQDQIDAEAAIRQKLKQKRLIKSRSSSEDI